MEKPKRSKNPIGRKLATLRQRIRELEAGHADSASAERKLHQYRTLLDALLNSNSDLFAVKRLDGTYQAASLSFCRFAGRTEEEIRGRNDFQIFPDRVAESFHRYDAMVRRSARPYCWEEEIAGPRKQWLRFQKSPMFSPDNECIGLLCSVRDITASRCMEQQNRVLARMGDHAHWVVDATGRILDANQAYCTLTGHARQEVIGAAIQDFDVSGGPEDLASRNQKAIEEGIAEFRAVHRLRNNQVMEVQVASVYLDIQGGRFFWLFQEAGTSSLPAPVEPPPSKPEREEPFVSLGPSGVAEGHWRMIDINEVVRQAANLQREGLPPHIRLEQDLERHPHGCMASQQQLLQALTVLLTNAVEAIDGRGTIRVATRNIEIGAELAQTFPHLEAGPYVLVAVEDNGRGISPRLLDKIFEPFITTKFRGRGMGLPSACRNIRDLGGHIAVKSTEGHGSTFTLYLPAVKEEMHASGPGAWTFPSAMETILIADPDHHAVQETRTMLERLAYTVLTAYDATAALHKIQTHHKEIHLTLLDAAVLAQSPTPLIPRFLAHRPAMKILVTGLADAHLNESSLTAEGASGFMAKPLRPEVLVPKMRQILDGRVLRRP